MAKSKSAYSDPGKKGKLDTHIIVVWVDNEAGVLARVVGLFSGRGYNIESLNVAIVNSGQHIQITESIFQRIGDKVDYIYLNSNENNISNFSIYLKAVDSISNDDVKLSERLYIPGRKLRGFESGKIGPKDGSDFIGGNYVSTINATTTIPKILENVQSVDIVLFADAANIWGVDYDSSLDKSGIRSSVGVGLDWLTPVGPLTFSFAQPITKEPTDIEETFRFNIGTSF